jgi:peroxiredoxin
MAVWLAATPAAPVGWVELVSAIVIAAVLTQGVLSWTLFRRYGQALARVEELERDAPRPTPEVGADALAFELSDVHGATVGLTSLLGLGRPVLVAFVDTACAPCRALFPDLRRWQEDLAERLTVVVVSRGTIEENRALATAYELDKVLAPETGETFERYGITFTPSAILVGSRGHVEAPVAEGSDAIRELVALQTEDAEDAGQAPGRRRSSAPSRAVVAAAGGAALAAAAPAWSRDEADDPEVEALRKTIASASPGLSKASAQTFAAVRQAVVFEGGRRARARKARAAARRAAKLLDAERAKLLELRKRLEPLPATSGRARNAKATALRALTLLADSLATRKRALIGKRADRQRLLAASDTLQRRALETILTSAELIAGAL